MEPSFTAITNNVRVIWVVRCFANAINSNLVWEETALFPVVLCTMKIQRRVDSLQKMEDDRECYLQLVCVYPTFSKVPYKKGKHTHTDTPYRSALLQATREGLGRYNVCRPLPLYTSLCHSTQKLLIQSGTVICQEQFPRADNTC